MQIETTMSSYIHRVHAFQLLSTLIEKSLRLSYLLGEILQTRRTEKTYGQPAHETDIRLDGKLTACPSPSRIKLLSLLDTPWCHPSLLPVLRRSRKLLANRGLCSSSCYLVVHPDVYLNRKSSLLFRTWCNGRAKKTSPVA